MMNMNRRDLCVALSSFAALAAALPARGPDCALPLRLRTVFSTQRALPIRELPVKKGPNGETRPGLHGVLPTGESVEVHETTLLPGHMPHPPHKHRHSELILIREGTVEFDNDGKFQRVGPGGVSLCGVERNAWTEERRRDKRQLFRGSDRTGIAGKPV